MSTAIARVEAACRALAEARTIPEVKEIRDKAQAIAQYLRQQKGGLAAAVDADELTVRAERKIGQLLVADGERRGRKKSSNGTSIPKGGAIPLPEGITKNQSSLWKKVAGALTPADTRFELE